MCWSRWLSEVTVRLFDLDVTAVFAQSFLRERARHP